MFDPADSGQAFSAGTSKPLMRASIQLPCSAGSHTAVHRNECDLPFGERTVDSAHVRSWGNENGPQFCGDGAGHAAGRWPGSLRLSGGLAACAYEDVSDPTQTATAEHSRRPAPSAPTKAPEILDAEAGNYAELEKRLAVAQGSLLLDESGPADGPGVGFSKTGTVKTAGAYTVTATCVGIPDARIFLSRPGSRELLALDLDCSRVLSQVVELQEGYVGALLMRHDPTGPWTGAVAGVRITVE